MTDHGAKALANRLHETDTADLSTAVLRDHARIILGKHGLFIPDVSKHEPWIDDRGRFAIQCRCGWKGWDHWVPSPMPAAPRRMAFESYFDHLSEPITESEQRLLDGNR